MTRYAANRRHGTPTDVVPATDPPIILASRHAARIARAVRHWVVETINWGVVPDRDPPRHRPSVTSRP